MLSLRVCSLAALNLTSSTRKSETSLSQSISPFPGEEECNGNDGHVHGYVAVAGLPSPLVPVDGLICFDYNTKTNEIRTFDLPVGKTGNDNTNSIVIGSNGEVLFAKNDGVLHCLVGPPRYCNNIGQHRKNEFNDPLKQGIELFQIHFLQ